MKQKFVLLTMLLTVLCCIALLHTPAAAAYSGQCGDTMTWTLRDNILYLSGSGEMYDYAEAEVPWMEHKLQILHLVAEPTVTSIGSHALHGFFRLETADLPSVTHIGSHAFKDCSALTVFSAPRLTAVPSYAFNGCRYLVQLYTSAVTSIGDFAFSGCEALEALSLPVLQTIGDGGFEYCRNLQQLSLPNLTAIGKEAFLDCTALSSVHLPALTQADKQSFYRCSALTDVSLPMLTEIGSGCFMSCTALTSVSLPALTVVESRSFYGCTALSQIMLPSAEHIASFAFGNCTALEHIGLTPALQSVDTNAFLDCSALSRVEFDGTADDWNKLVIGSGNDVLLRAMLWVNPFTDVTIADYYYLPVLWAVAHDITTGTNSNTFSPHAPCTRAQIVTFLWRHAGSPAPLDSTLPFTDVSDDAYCRDAVLWAATQGITTGTTPSTFSPNSTCTRAEIVTFLWRYAGSPTVDIENPFADNEQGSFCYEAVLWAARHRITKGVSDTMFDTWAPCTRAHAVTFLYRGEL